MTRYHHLTNYEMIRIIELRKGKFGRIYGIKEIARDVKCTPATVRYWLKRSGNEMTVQKKQ